MIYDNYCGDAEGAVRAFKRALTIGKLRNPQPRLLVFVAVDGEAVDTLGLVREYRLN